MKYLFTKAGCDACEWIKSHVDLQAAKDLRIYNLDGADPEALAMLAYYELVPLSEKNLPILLCEEMEERQVITGPIVIKQHIEHDSA